MGRIISEMNKDIYIFLIFLFSVIIRLMTCAGYPESVAKPGLLREIKHYFIVHIHERVCDRMIIIS